MTAVLDHALNYARAGLPVFPVGADKKPLLSGGFHSATRDTSTVAGWFRDNPRAGVAVPMGPPSGVWALDIDVERVNPVTGKITRSGEEALAALVDRFGQLPSTLSQRTSGGGRQLLFRWRGERIRNRASDLGPGLDTRGVKPDGTAGGYIVLPPSPHHSGGHYSWLTPCDLSCAVPAPAWLVFLATFGRHKREALAAIGITGPEAFGNLPVPEWPDRAAQLLAEAEVKRTANAANGAERPAAGGGGAREHYARAAIEKELADLAATAPDSQDVGMNNAALRIWGLVRGASIEGEASSFRALFLDACRRLPNQPGRERWTEQEFATKWDRARDAARPRDLSHVEERVVFRAGTDRTRDGERKGTNGTDGTGAHDASGRAADGDAWDAPDLSLLGTGRRPAPEFPLALLGQFWGFWSKRRSAAASAPVDYVATALLACAGAALGNVRWPFAGADWSEPPVLWVGEVGNPSSGKSPALDQALALLAALEERLAIGHDEERRTYETKKQIAEASREEWKGRVREAVKNGETPPVLPADAEVPTAPERPRVKVSDFSTEKLTLLAAALPRGLLVVRDELSGWLGSFDRYGGKGADRSFALESYGGGPYTVDRVKNPEPIQVRHLSVGVLGGVQPDKLSLILDGPDDGLSARILWAWPDQAPEFNLARERSDEGEARTAFLRLADLQMGTDAAGNPEPVRVRLVPAAEEVLEEFAREMRRRGEDASGPMAGALGKARGHALRLSAVLTFLWWCDDRDAREPTTISAEAVTCAAALVGSYFLPMAERVFGDAAIPPADRAAMALARHLRRLGLSTFNARTLHNSIGGTLRNADAMKKACANLAEAGLIRSTSTRPGRQGGRPSSDWEVNPALHGRAA